MAGRTKKRREGEVGREKGGVGELSGRGDEARRGGWGYGRSGSGVKVLSREARTRTTMGARMAAGEMESIPGRYRQ